MKAFGLVMVWCLVVQGTGAQTVKEWLRQKKTQIEYLEKQIVALQVYIELGQKGYGLYQDGLTFIGDLKKGELDLHAQHFAALEQVKPAIGGSTMVEEIFGWQQDILHIRSQATHIDAGQYQPYVRDVFDELTEEAEHCARETRLLIADGHYQLSDDERIKKIDERHEQMLRYFGFATWMGRQVAMIVLGDQQEEKDGHVLKSLLDIK